MFSNSTMRARNLPRKISWKKEAPSVLRASIQLDTGQAAHRSQAKHNRTAQTTELLLYCLSSPHTAQTHKWKQTFRLSRGSAANPASLSLNSIELLPLFSSTGSHFPHQENSKKPQFSCKHGTSPAAWGERDTGIDLDTLHPQNEIKSMAVEADTVQCVSIPELLTLLTNKEKFLM